MKPVLLRLSRIRTPAQAHASRYVIAPVFALATMFEMLDNSMGNVAIPSRMGNLGATLDETAWVTLPGVPVMASGRMANGPNSSH